MYKVMLVDDDYPVLEYLTEMINWDGLGMTLQSVHVNGLSALKEAETNFPDILITDIGMPKLNGIELIKKLKEKSPALLVSILSCHSEFEFAQQALKLNVQEYILKDMLDLEQIEKLLGQFKQMLDIEKENKRNQLQMAHTIERNKGFLIERFINKTIYQPINEEKDWYNEASLLGLHHHQKYIIILCIVDDYQSVLNQFRSKEKLNFIFHNVITEVIKDENMNGVYGYFEKKESFLFIPINKEHGEEIGRMKGFIRKLQEIFQKTFGIRMSFVIGNAVEKPQEIKKQMIHLIESNQPSLNTEIANACRYIEENIHRKITLDEVASHLHLNSSYFSRLFKKEVGENFVKYVVNIKMQRAKELLEQTNCTILEISEQLGYENQSYFNKTFKSIEGISPFEYRNGILQKNFKI